MKQAITDTDFEQVLDSARAGEDWAWDSLYGEFAPVVLRDLRARRATEPEDTLAEVFLQLVRNLSSFEGTAVEFRAWIVTIAHRRMIDEGRRRTRKPLDFIDAEILQRLGPTGNAEQEALAALSTASARSIIASLSPDQRDVLLLRFLGGLTTDEVARAIGKRPGAVKALQARGVAAIRRKVGAEAVSLSGARTLVQER